MALLSRVADRLYWGARYVERAEDTARIVRSYTDLIVDLPIDLLPYSWEPLVAIAGSETLFGEKHGEHAVIEFLVADRENPGSMASSVAFARENLRTTREVLPREAWRALNGLQQYVLAEAERAVERRTRDRFLARVIADSRRLDGELESTMTRAAPVPHVAPRPAHRARRHDDRVLGVRAASILQMRVERPCRRSRRGAVDGCAALGRGAADVPARDPRSDRGPIGRAVLAVLLAVPAFGAGLPRRDAGAC